MISVGEKLPEATLGRMGENGPEQIALSEKVSGRKVVIVAVPGAFSTTCDQAHLPSFIRTKAQFDDNGVDEIICLSVNDPWVMDAWGKSTGATAAGITMLSDGDSAFTKAIGMEFSAPVVGFVDRSQRYAMLVEDGTVKVLQMEEGPGVCDATAGEGLLAAMS